MTLLVTIAAARKMEMSPEKIDDARIWGELQLPYPPGSYAYAQQQSHLNTRAKIINKTTMFCLLTCMTYIMKRLELSLFACNTEPY